MMQSAQRAGVLAASLILFSADLVFADTSEVTYFEQMERAAQSAAL
jgi:hypothetical protein